MNSITWRVQDVQKVAGVCAREACGMRHEAAGRARGTRVSFQAHKLTKKLGGRRWRACATRALLCQPWLRQVLLFVAECALAVVCRSLRPWC